MEERTKRKIDKRSEVRGQKFNMLTALEPTEFTKHKGVLWKFLCDCGNEVLYQVFRVRNGTVKSCGCMHDKAKFKRGRTSIHRSLSRAASYMYTKYKKSASSRVLPFNLSKAEFTSIIQKDCYYCGDLPETRVFQRNSTWSSEWEFNGVDRKDNFEGYTLDNCVPCCTTCNMMKKSLTEEEYINKCIKIGRSWEKKK